MPESKVASCDDIKEELSHAEVPQDKTEIDAEIAKGHASLVQIEAEAEAPTSKTAGEVHGESLPTTKMGESLDGSGSSGQSPPISNTGLDELLQPESSKVAKKNDEPIGAGDVVQHNNGADGAVSGATKTSEPTEPHPEPSRSIDTASAKKAAKAAAKKQAKSSPKPKAAKRTAKAKTPAKGTLSISAAMSKAAKK